MALRFEWDERKRLVNIEKHALDFWDVGEVFAAPHLVVSARHAGSEERWLAVGLLEGRFVTVVFTIRAETLRVISFRRARHEERSRYQDVLGGRA